MPKRNGNAGPLKGFPLNRPFETIAEIDEYFSGNLIQCLECGHMYRALGYHLKSHGMNADEYKEKYGIPWGYGLISGQLRGVHSENGKRVGCDHLKGFAGQMKGMTLPTRGYAHARRVAKMAYSEADYYQMAKRIAEGEPFLTVSREKGVPSVEAVKKYRKFNEEFDRFWRESVEPNMMVRSAAARARLQDGTVEKAKAMLAKEFPVREVAEATGYSEAMVRLIRDKKVWN